MLTRLKVNGFKNLVDLDVHFGPFTCVAGPNGAGKSNLFDAIAFLSALASKNLIDAAVSVRDEGGRSGDVASLFFRSGDYVSPTMSFEAEMIIPAKGVDDLGQLSEATATFLRYSLELGRRRENHVGLGGLEILREDLHYVARGDAHNHLPFPHSASRWRHSVVVGRRFASFVTTEEAGVIKIHQDKHGGMPKSYVASTLPRTVVSAATASENPTMLLARREMQSWRILQLEPSALRQPDPFNSSGKVGVNGAHLAATLWRLASGGGEKHSRAVLQQVANRLSDLYEDVRDVFIDRDDKRELLTLFVRNRDGTPHPARALSDGTLRFLALTVLENDPEAVGVLCLEEPENGIHPERVPAMLKLLVDLAVAVDEPCDENNPLRQVIVSTHSPAVVAQVPEDSLLLALAREYVKDGRHLKRLELQCLKGSWRKGIVAAKGNLLAYLTIPRPLPSESVGHRRVIDSDEAQLVLNYGGGVADSHVHPAR